MPPNAAARAARRARRLIGTRALKVSMVDFGANGHRFKVVKQIGGDMDDERDLDLEDAEDPAAGDGAEAVAKEMPETVTRTLAQLTKLAGHLGTLLDVRRQAALDALEAGSPKRKSLAQEAHLNPLGLFREGELSLVRALQKELAALGLEKARHATGPMMDADEEEEEAEEEEEQEAAKGKKKAAEGGQPAAGGPKDEEESPFKSPEAEKAFMARLEPYLQGQQELQKLLMSMISEEAKPAPSAA